MKQPTKDAAVLQRVRADLASAFEEVDRLAAEKRELESQLAARFVEVAALTRIATRAEDERDAAVEALRLAGAGRLQAVAALSEQAPWRWLPSRMRAVMLAPIVRRTGLIDEKWYASHYQDVAARGFDPVRHFVAYGMKEGRFPNSEMASAGGMTAGGERTETGR